MTSSIATFEKASVPFEVADRIDAEAAIEELLGALSLEDKVRLLTGETSWRMYPDDRIGLRSMAVSDGPVGVRGHCAGVANIISFAMMGLPSDP